MSRDARAVRAGCRRHGARALVVLMTMLVGFAPATAAAAPLGPPVSAGMTRGDFVHISGTPPASASAHGWWVYPRKTELVADVTVWLQIKRGDSWVDVGSPGVERVRPGGGSANRSHARVRCLTSQPTEWRSIVDVDVVGKWDSPGKLYTPGRVLRCGT